MKINSFMLNALPITLSQLNLILLGIGGLFLFFSIFWGMVRGFKKTSFRGLWLVFTIILLFLLTPAISNLLLNADFSFLGANIAGEPFTTINNAIITFAESQGYSQIVADNPVIAEALIKIPLLIFNSIIFVLLFWLLKILLYPVWAIISAIIIKKKKPDGTKVKKHRLAGMAVGAVIGLLIGSITLMPIMNYTKLVSKIEAQTTSAESAEEGGLITLALSDDGEILAYINAVHNSSLNNIYKITGLETLNSAIFSGLSSTHINKHSVRLENEALNIAKVAKLALSLEDINTDIAQLTKEELSQLLDVGNELIEQVFKISTLSALGDSLLPYFATNIATNPDFIITLPENENQHLDKLLRDSVKTFENFNFANLKSDLQSLISVVRTLNDADILLPLLNANTDNLEDIQNFTKTINTEELTKAINTLFGMKSISSISPIAINTAIALGYEELASGDQQITLNYDDIPVSHLQHIFSELVSTVLEIFNELDLNSDFYVGQPSTIVKVGTIVDLIKSYQGVPESEYDKLINSAIELAKEQTDAISDIATPELITTLHSVIENLANINSFESELFAPISLILQDVLDIYEIYEQSDNLINDLDLGTIGRILDNIKTISIIAPEFENIIINSIDLVVNMFELPSEFSGFVNAIIEGAKENIKPTIVWEDELPLFKDFAEIIINIDLDDMLTSAGLTEFGEALDTLSESKLIGNKLNIIVSEVLTLATDMIPAEDIDIFNDIINDIQTNLENVNNQVVWKTEMQAIGKLLDLVDVLDGSYSEFGKVLDDLEALNSQLINRELINNLVESILTTAFEELDDAQEFEDVLQSIISNIENVIRFETELEDLFTFIDDLQDALNSEELNLTALGQKLDDLENSILVAPARVEVVKMIFDNALDEVTDPDVLDMMQGVKDDLVADLENKTLTYTEALTQLDELLETLQELSPELNNSDASFLGPLLNTLQDLDVFGKVRTADIVITIAEDLITQIQEEIDSYNEAPEYQVIIDGLNQAISDLQNEIIFLENIENNPIPDYEVYLNDLYEIADAN